LEDNDSFWRQVKNQDKSRAVSFRFGANNRIFNRRLAGQKNSVSRKFPENTTFG
jgi:hypothetical protein